MQQHLLGSTGLRITPLGLGLAALGRPGYINLGHAGDLERDYDVETMRRRTAGVLDAAWAAGIRYVDTARSYGRAEEFLASWLGSHPEAARSLTIGSKWGYTYTAAWQTQAEHHEVKNHSLATFERQLDESRSHLGAHLRLYQIHSATIESGVLDDDAVLTRLATLRREGVRVGLSSSGPRQAEILRRALAIRVDGERVFDTVQATWNLLERSAGDALAEAHAAGVGVIVKEALANGRLTSRNEMPAFAAPRRRLEVLAARLGCTLDALALGAAMAQPWVDVVLSGAATVEQLESNVAAMQVEWSASVDAALADLVEAPEAYWRARSGLPWN